MAKDENESTADAEQGEIESGELRAKRPRSRSRSPGARDYYRRHGRSRSPADRENDETQSRRRSRSGSPGRHASRKNRSGFKWKEKSGNNEEGSRSNKLERGYRGQEHRERDRYRDRSRDRERDYDGDRRRDRRDARDSYRRDDERDREEDSRSFRDERRDFKAGREREKKDWDAYSEKSKEPKKEKREKKVVASASQTMIIVYVNDRLGTKASIPCLPSDPIKLFKAQVAARIGREPHEIMLKRQGERPFKDQLTLEDYGVSNGVQLDLELDTGE